MNHRQFPAVLTLLCLSVPAFAQDQHDLKIAAKKGNSVWLLQESKQEQTIDMMGQSMESAQTVVHTMHYVIKDIDDQGNLIVETTIARIHGSMSVPMMGDTDFDSAKPAAADDDDDGGAMPGMPSMGKLTKAMTQGAGKTFTVKVSPKGMVVGNVSGVEELAKSADNKMGPALDEKMMHGMVESAFGTLPEKAVAIGEKWQHESKEPATRMPMKTKLELTLNKVEPGSFEIGSTGTIMQADKAAKADDDGKADDDNQMAAMMKSMKVKDGKVAGTLRVSSEDGFIIESKSVTSMNIEMGEEGGGMSIATKVTATTKRTTAEAAMPKATEKGEKAEKAEKKEGKDGGK